MEDNQQKIVFAEKLKGLLTKNNLSQKQVAEAIGVKPGAFSSWCVGSKIPRMATIQNLAIYFGVDVAYFFENEAAPSTINNYTVNGIKVTVSEEEVIDDNDPTVDLFESMRNRCTYFGYELTNEDKLELLKYLDSKFRDQIYRKLLKFE